MAERRLRAPDLGTQLGVSSCLEKCLKSSLDAGRQQPFSGKSFFLDLPAGKTLQFLTGAIQQLGGVIEGFLSKEVSYVVSSRREAKAESCGTSHRGCSSPSEVRVEATSMASPRASPTRPSQKPTESVPMSRGQELLQKAIRNQGSSSLPSSARSWGVRILHVDDMMMHVRQLSSDALRLKKRGPEKPEGACPAESRTRRVARLKAPFLKVEDESRKFRPFHHQFKSFPEISFLGPKDASPFEALTTPGSSHRTREPKNQDASPRSAAHTVPRRRDGDCGRCQEAFEDLHGNLQSAQHQRFALEAHPYAEVDRIIAQLNHSLVDAPFQAGRPRQPGSLASDHDLLCPETPSPSQPSCGGAASPRMREEDDHQAPGDPQQHGVMGGVKVPAECGGAGEVPGPVASCQDLGVSADVIVDPPGTLVSRSPTHQCLLTSCGFADLSSGPDLALVGHKRKVQFPSGNAEKRPGVSWPQASFFVPRVLSPCGTWATNGRQLFSLPLPSHESRPLTFLLPFCPQQTSLSLPDPFPWHLPDRRVELWDTPPPWPGGRCPPGSVDSECAAPSPVSQQLLCRPRPTGGPPALSCGRVTPGRACREPGYLSPQPPASQPAGEQPLLAPPLPVSRHQQQTAPAPVSPQATQPFEGPGSV